MIDAGHGGYDVGAESYYGDYEKDINVNFLQYLYIYTKKHSVVLSQRVFFMIHSMLVLFY